MGRQGDGYDGTILLSCDISDVGCSSRSGGGQEDSQAYSLMAIVAEIMGAINSAGIEFLDDLGRRITQVTQVSLMTTARNPSIKSYSSSCL